jgi:23S rRNA (cytidine1920-2'-O)/16S rRNA (cytidine1409-2'-O)-methyltransferase
VYAIDVGKGILHWKIRQDPRVIVMEGTNARYVISLPEPVEIVTIDTSFISLKIILPVVRQWFFPTGTSDKAGHIIALIKPQFEAGRFEAARGDGVIRDPVIHQQVVHDVLEFAEGRGFRVNGVIQSPLIGPKGNIEFLTWLTLPPMNN